MPSYRPWGSSEDGDIEFESLTSETFSGAINVIRESFFKDENVCKGVDLLSEQGASEELEELCKLAAQDGVSVVAIDVNTREVVGVAFNKIQVITPKSFYDEFIDNCKCKSSKGLVEFMLKVDKRIDLFKHYNVDCILEIMFLATLSHYRKRRIGELLVTSSLELGRQLYKNKKAVKTPIFIDDRELLTNSNNIPSLASAIMTTKYSQKIADKLTFDNLIEVSFDEFIFAGKKFSQRIGSNDKTCRLVAKRLS